MVPEDGSIAAGLSRTEGCQKLARRDTWLKMEPLYFAKRRVAKRRDFLIALVLVAILGRLPQVASAEETAAQSTAAEKLGHPRLYCTASNVRFVFQEAYLLSLEPSSPPILLFAQSS